ncbi:RNA-directed DNA polymerase [Henriciella sp. AS95]|uniref:RNA-directed DNA polymerase n=1 Tax=Henriciella sp. AS95 TaxID=3135782 RepID=UPI003175793B
MSVLERLLQPENLNYAWTKTKALIRAADGFVDSAEVAAFEIDLEQSLLKIHRQFERGSYKLKKLRPLPRPKKISEERPDDRQYYHIAIEDQVAWIAVVNALGPELDRMMQPWSYGNRLYRPAWYEPDEAGQSKLEIGPYRHASGHLYRRFQHSWPLFRRHVTLTARMMVRKSKLNWDEMDVADQLAEATAEREDLVYFRKDWWNKDPASSEKSELFHASIDLEKFYPNLKVDAVLKGLNLAGALNDPKMSNLLNSMLNFKLDMSGMTSQSLKNVKPEFNARRFQGLPTGLFVSGFLANAAMLPIDRTVADRLRQCKDVAHFRFVDDHTIIAFDFNTLCDWIDWYEELLSSAGIGATVNIEKYDPPELAAWMGKRRKGKTAEQSAEEYKKAVQETRLDGKNPTKLMTKTLAQVSAIATTDIHILDDDDLDERLTMLEWLLLADIPEREIRPDTRASFAAGQIASLVPVLVQEVDGVVDVARRLAEHQSRKPDPERSTEEDLEQYNSKLGKLKDQFASLTTGQEVWENKLLKRCFLLLLQSLREHPGKARLFYRIHQYCQSTGYRGINEISDWLKETRAEQRETWADYYTALSLQIMAKAMLASAARLIACDSLRSETKAAESYLKDIASLDIGVFVLPVDRETWFQAVGRREFGVALLQVAELLTQNGYQGLARDLRSLSQKFVPVRPASPAKAWLEATGWSAGVWAHLAESIVGTHSHPSSAWLAVSRSFDFSEKLDLSSARRFPEAFPDDAWKELLFSSEALPQDDSGWLRQVIEGNAARYLEARQSSKNAFSRTIRSIDAAKTQNISLIEWTEKLKELSPFDPRRSEWTALEIVRRLLDDAKEAGHDLSKLDRLHPANVLLPHQWFDVLNEKIGSSKLGWEEWRNFISNEKNGKIVVQPLKASLLDYRFANDFRSGIPSTQLERWFTAVGRILLGLLRADHSAPRIWNLRGNERVYPLPRSRIYSELAVSSATTQLLDACLAARPAETRNIALRPDLFALDDGEPVRDVAFDPDQINDLDDLIESVNIAQGVLQENQLSVSSNRPRQLIPFKLQDFAAGTENAEANDPMGGENVE